MNAETFNSRFPVGAPVFAYPGARPEDIPSARRLVTRTRSRATVLGGHTAVVWVEDYGSCIALSHVDVVSESVWQAAKEADPVVEAAKPKDTLPAWLYQRFAVIHGCPPWDTIADEDRAYWEHQAAAVRRAVEQGGFKNPITTLPDAVAAEGALPMPAGPHVSVSKTAAGTDLTFTPGGDL